MKRLKQLIQLPGERAAGEDDTDPSVCASSSEVESEQHECVIKSVQCKCPECRRIVHVDTDTADELEPKDLADAIPSSAKGGQKVQTIAAAEPAAPPKKRRRLLFKRPVSSLLATQPAEATPPTVFKRPAANLSAGISRPVKCIARSSGEAYILDSKKVYIIGSKDGTAVREFVKLLNEQIHVATICDAKVQHKLS